jgi:hypothetical protein
MASRFHPNNWFTSALPGACWGFYLLFPPPVDVDSIRDHRQVSEDYGPVDLALPERLVLPNIQ